MSLTHPNTPVSQQDLKNFYNKIKGYLGFPVMPQEDMSEVIDPLPKPTASDYVEKNGLIFYRGNLLYAISNVNLYVDYDNGVDDFDGGYGFSTTKPFKTLEYAVKYIPPLVCTTNGSIKVHLLSDFTASSFKTVVFRSNSQIQIFIDNAITITNYKIQFSLTNGEIKLNNNLSLLLSDAITSGQRLIESNGGFVNIYGDTNTRVLSLKGTSTNRTNVNGIYTTNGGTLITQVNVTGQYLNNFLWANVASMQNHNVNITATDVSNGMNSTNGSIISYKQESITATNKTVTAQGGRIYTGAQS